MQVAALRREVANLKELVRTRNEEIATLQVKLQAASGVLHEPERLPMPVAFAASMVDSSSEPLASVENLRKALSILLRYLAAVALAEYHAAGAFDEELNATLRDAFSRSLTDGGWLMVSSEVARSFLEHEREPTYFTPAELTGLWHRDRKHWAPLHGTLDRLVKLRNQIHDSGFIDESTARAWLDEASPRWRTALEQALPLLECRLLYIEALRDFADDAGSLARYGVRWLMGEHFVPRSEEVEWRAGLRKGKLYLTGAEAERFLLLSPPLEYEHCPITRAREVCSFERCDEDGVVLSTFRFPYSFTPGTTVGLPFLA